jgi:O-acetyl-ADP-ribose deacetylase (regulator of RNase III)
VIEYRQGDIFASGAAGLVNPVNAKGVSGKGLALAFKKRYPEAQRWYEYRCRMPSMPEVVAGRCYCYSAIEPAILFFTTKDTWRSPSRVEWIRSGLVDLVWQVATKRLTSIAMPAVGCGLGGLDYRNVKPLLQTAAKQMSAKGVDVFVYEPMEEST